MLSLSAEDGNKEWEIKNKKMSHLNANSYLSLHLLAARTKQSANFLGVENLKDENSKNCKIKV